MEMTTNFKIALEQAEIRALLTHPMDQDAESIYRRFGFISSSVCEGATSPAAQERLKVCAGEEG